MTILKGWRTVAFNVLSMVLPILEMTEVMDVIPDDWLIWYSLGIALANLLLRYVTTTPVGQNA